MLEYRVALVLAAAVPVAYPLVFRARPCQKGFLGPLDSQRRPLARAAPGYSPAPSRVAGTVPGGARSRKCTRLVYLEMGNRDGVEWMPKGTPTLMEVALICVILYVRLVGNATHHLEPIDLVSRGRDKGVASVCVLLRPLTINDSRTNASERSCKYDQRRMATGNI